jgi:ATP-dependent RNA helicase DeaD
MGFRDDIDFVLKNTVRRESTWMFSATMLPEIKAISKNFMRNPQEVTVGKKNIANVNIAHQYFITPAHSRYETLKRLVDFNPGMYGIIFTRTKADAQEITERLVKEDYDIEALHGDLTQQQRDKVMSRFRQKNIQLLIATDVAARGIDVEGITHIINYELPDDMEVYTHRSGRTARAGKSGICISICHSREAYKIRQLEKMTNAQFHRLDIPTGNDVCRKQFFHFMDKLMAADTSHGEYETYLTDLQKKFADISKEDVLKRVAALEFNHFLKYYKNAEDLNARNDFREKRFEGNNRDVARRDRGSFSSDNGFTRLFINLGTKDGFYKASFLQYILDESDLKKDMLGKIDLREMNAWVEIDKSVAGKMIKAIDGKKYHGRLVRMNEADSGFKRPTDEGGGRKRIPMREKRY